MNCWWDEGFIVRITPGQLELHCLHAGEESSNETVVLSFFFVTHTTHDKLLKTNNPKHQPRTKRARPSRDLWLTPPGLSSRPLESCHHQCLSAVCGVLGYPKGSASDLLDGTLKLRYCTTIFTTRFTPWSLPRVGNGSGKRQLGIPGSHSDPGGHLGKQVRLTKKTRPGVFSHFYPDPGHPTPRRWKRLRPPSSEGVGGEVGEPRHLFPRLGVG